MSEQFVIHIHRGYGDDHYDLMIEQGQALATWQLPASAAALEGPCEAMRLADHRRHYLAYEGPVSNNRGSVTVVDRGECTVLTCLDDRWVVEFHGRLLQGRRELVRLRGDRWQLRP